MVLTPSRREPENFCWNYEKKTERKELEQTRQKAQNQVKAYLDSEEVKQLKNLKSWVIVFVGEKAEMVEERGNEEKKT